MSTTDTLLQQLFFKNPISKLTNYLISKIELISDLSNHFSNIFLKSISSNWQKFLFTLGVAGITYSAFKMLRNCYIWSYIWTKHQLNQTKITADKIKQKYGDCWVAITGFTQGIGWSFVQQLLRLNMKLVLIGRNKSKIDKKVQLLKQKYPQCQLQIIIGDLSKVSDINKICEDLKSLSQRIDIGVLINNAGLSNAGQFIEADSKNIIDISETNFTAVVELNKTLLPIFRARRQRSAIVNVSSCTGKFISHYLLSYSSSKRMLNVYNHFLKKQNQDKIDVLLAMPFGVITPMMKMKKDFFMISPDTCARSIIGDLMGGTLQTHGGLKHKFIGLMFNNLSEQQAANRFAKLWKSI